MMLLWAIMLACTIVPDGENWVAHDCTLEEAIEWATPRGIGAGAVMPLSMPSAPSGVIVNVQ